MLTRLAKENGVELGMTAISKAPDQTQTELVIGALIITAGFPLCYYLRRLFYPCLTISELTNAEKCLNDTFNNAYSALSLCGHDLEDITQAKLRLEERASTIRSKGYQGPASFWKTRLGIDVALIPSIVDWYNDTEELERKILGIVERVKCARINHELNMRETTYAPADAQPVAITGREVDRPQALRHRNRRPDPPVPEVIASAVSTVADA
ncbi:40S ribosomal protein S6 [Paramarasmius palmivorus]|uniref:40S ribosomal protein S6 n=1 Tax=Paramarasmius palmivorus TaxID=297713 RepID=A0AAW0AXF6_9AGAR